MGRKIKRVKEQGELQIARNTGQKKTKHSIHILQEGKKSLGLLLRKIKQKDR